MFGRKKGQIGVPNRAKCPTSSLVPNPMCLDFRDECVSDKLNIIILFTVHNYVSFHPGKRCLQKKEITHILSRQDK